MRKRGLDPASASGALFPDVARCVQELGPSAEGESRCSTLGLLP